MVNKMWLIYFAVDVLQMCCHHFAVGFYVRMLSV